MAKVDLVLKQGLLKGDPGEPGAKGDPGEPGYTPVKGVDYFTDEEIAAITEGYATTEYVDKAVENVSGVDLSEYALKTDIADFVKQSALNSYALKTDLTGYAKTTDLTGYAKTADLANYQTAQQVQAAIEENLSAIGVAEDGAY